MNFKYEKEQVLNVIFRFYSKYKLRRTNEYINPNNFILEKLNDIHIIKIYTKMCTYSNEQNIKKENIIIIFKLNDNKDIINLNLTLDEYKDLFI
jgi:hypothetical protein